MQASGIVDVVVTMTPGLPNFSLFYFPLCPLLPFLCVLKGYSDVLGT